MSWMWWTADSKRRRRIEALPVMSIANAPETECRIVGAACADGPALFAPLTHRACVYYRFEIEDWANSRMSVSKWKTQVSETRAVAFAIEDASGRALVDPMYAEVDLDLTHASDFGLFSDATPAQLAVLDERDISPRGMIFGKRMRFREWILEIGHPVAVVGSPTREPDPAGSPALEYRGDAPTRIRFSGSPEHPILLASTLRATATGGSR